MTRHDFIKQQSSYLNRLADAHEMGKTERCKELHGLLKDWMKQGLEQLGTDEFIASEVALGLSLLGKTN